jgi:ABC-type ATPase involved in cell division
MLNEFKLLREVNLKPYLAVWLVQLVIGLVSAYFWRLVLQDPTFDNIRTWIGMSCLDIAVMFVGGYCIPQMQIELYAAFSRKHHQRFQTQDPEIRRIQESDDFHTKVNDAWESLKYATLTLFDMVPICIRLVSYLWQIYQVSPTSLVWVLVGHSAVFYILYTRMKAFNSGYIAFNKVRSTQNKVSRGLYALYGKFHTIDDRVGNRIWDIENQQIRDGSWREAFWTKYEAMCMFSGVFILMGILCLFPINREYLPVVLLITYLEGMIVTLAKFMGRFDYWGTKIRDLITLEAGWGEPYIYSGTYSVPSELVIDNIKKRYPERVYELTGEPLTIHQGDRIRVWGKTGSGKSTLFGIISAAFKANCYTLWAPAQVYTNGFRDFIPNQIIEFPQNVGRATSSKESFRKQASTYVDIPTDQELIEVLMIMRLWDWWQTEGFNFDTPLPNGKSGGQQSRICVAAALTRCIRLRPKIVIFDEMTGEIDAATAYEIMCDIFRVLEGTTIIFASHDESILSQSLPVTQNWLVSNGVVSAK